jgi:hypothetical protein
MEDIPMDDYRAQLVREWFPDLKPVHYRASENQNDVLVEWTDKLGRWGMVIFSKLDRSFRTAYHYGVWSSLMQRLAKRRSA